MVRHLWSVCCERPIVDARTNNISLMHVIEQVKVPSSVEVVPVSVTVVSLWLFEDTDQVAGAATRTIWRAPGGGELLTTDPLDLPTDKKRCRVMNEFRGLRIQGQGDHEFVIEYRPSEDAEWEERARVPIDILFEQPE